MANWDCPKKHLHTKQPAGYLARQAWAEKKARTHEQTRCPGCGLWLVWKKRAVSERT